MFTCGSPVQRSDCSRKAGLYLEMNQDTLVPQLQRSGTPWTGLLGVFSDVDHWAAFDNDQLIIIARNSTSTLKSSLPASWLKETREIVLYSLIHGISLIIAVSEVVKKNAVSNCRCLLWSAEHSMSDRWSRKWISANKISFAFHKRVLDFCLCAFQCGRGSAQKP